MMQQLICTNSPAHLAVVNMYKGYMSLFFDWTYGAVVGFEIADEVDKEISEINFGLTLYFGIFKVVIWN